MVTPHRLVVGMDLRVSFASFADARWQGAPYLHPGMFQSSDIFRRIEIVPFGETINIVLKNVYGLPMPVIVAVETRSIIVPKNIVKLFLTARSIMPFTAKSDAGL